MADESVGAFWEDLQRDLGDEEFRRHYVLSSLRITATDALVNALDAQREAYGMSKADLARAAGKTPEAVRRLLTVDNPNPTLGTFVELAAVLGMKLTVQPMTEEERDASRLAPCPPGRLAPS
jgi:DNA-binding phage protein